MLSREWHPVRKFPTPGVKLLVRTQSGQEIEAIRPNYAKSYSDEPDYRDLATNNRINEVIEWSLL